MPLKYWQHVREERQAEFLVRDFFDWRGVATIGVPSDTVAASVKQLLTAEGHNPQVVVEPRWYYEDVR